MQTRKGIGLLLALLLVCNLLTSASASTAKSRLDKAIAGSSAYLRNAVSKPQFGNEWLILGLARSGVFVPRSYFDRYYASVEEYVRSCEGVLHTKRYTEYSRTIVALSAIGAEPTDVAGYNLLTALGDYDATVSQGLNGAIWALIALDSGSYDMPVNGGAATQATRQMYVDLILSRQLEDGGWSLSRTGRSDTDMTAMALQALAKYQDQAAVKRAVEKALTRLSETQNEDGGFSSYGVANAESCVQVVVALCELGLDLADSRFVKNGNTVLDKLLSYQNEEGSFLYKADDTESSGRASEHALYGLAAALRAVEGKSSLYRMDDVKVDDTEPSEPPQTEPEPVLPDKKPGEEAAPAALRPLLPGAEPDWRFGRHRFARTWMDAETVYHIPVHS